jgi:hypothetical protein
MKIPFVINQKIITFVYQFTFKQTKIIMKNQVIFLANKFNPELEGTYFAIDSERIETLNVSDTYDQFGQRISSYDAGDYVEITNFEKFSELHPELVESVRMSKDDILCFDGDSDVFFELEKIGEGDYFNFYFTECKGFNYWNGNNWRTIVSEHSGIEQPEWEIVEDKKLNKRLRTALGKKVEVGKGFAMIEYKHGKVSITKNLHAGAWEDFFLEIDE